MPIFKKVNKDFFKKWSPEMAYVLGFFAADGYMTLNKRGAHFWCLQIIDRTLLESIKSTIGAEHVISVRERLGTANTIYRLQIGSKEMCNDLRRLGMGERKARSMTVPHVPKKYFPHFIRGYFDGDGNVWVGYVHTERRTKLRTIRTVFTSCSRAFLEAIRVQLEVRNIYKGVISKGQGDYYRLTYSVSNSLKLSDLMYTHNIPASQFLFLERKREKFREFITLRG